MNVFDEVEYRPTVEEVDELLSKYAALKAQEAEIKAQISVLASDIVCKSDGILTDRSNSGWRVVRKERLHVVNEDLLKASAPELFVTKTVQVIDNKQLNESYKAGDERLVGLVASIAELVLQAETRKGK